VSYPFEALPLQPITANNNADFQVYAIIEQAAGDTERSVWDEAKRSFIKTGMTLSVPWPVPYGWIPQTRNPGDGDPLDVLLLTQAPVAQGSYLIVRPVGVLLRHDQDHKVLAVDVQDERFGQIQDYAQLSQRTLTRIEDWFRPYFILDGWDDAARARQMIEQAHATFLDEAGE